MKGYCCYGSWAHYTNEFLRFFQFSEPRTGTGTYFAKLTVISLGLINTVSIIFAGNGTFAVVPTAATGTGTLSYC